MTFSQAHYVRSSLDGDDDNDGAGDDGKQLYRSSARNEYHDETDNDEVCSSFDVVRVVTVREKKVFHIGQGFCCVIIIIWNSFILNQILLIDCK